MARYYFRLTNGDEVVKMPKGIDLPGNAAAREEALILARDLKEGRIMPERKWGGWFVSVVDQHGHDVETVPVDVMPEKSAGPLT
jgi:hypothetical protein